MLKLDFLFCFIDVGSLRDRLAIGMNGVMIRIFLGIFIFNIVALLIYFIKGT